MLRNIGILVGEIICFYFKQENFYPKGQKFRTLIKEIFTLGLFDAEKSMQTKVLDGPYTDEIGEKYVKSIQGA